MGPLIDLATGLVEAGTVLGLVLIVVLLGLRPVTRLLLEQRQAEQLAGGVLSEGGGAAGGAAGDQAAITGDSVAAAELLGMPSPVEPNLIEDITSDVLRLSQKRLEQMVALDEEQAANVLKSWMRERAA